MKTFFCLTENDVPPQKWTEDLLTGNPVHTTATGDARFTLHWLYQTWLLLNASGTQCQVTFNKLSENGILIALSTAASKSLKMPASLFFVDVVAESLPHPAAHLHIIHNRAYAKKIPNSFFMPHWPQTGLIPRDPRRGDRFENVCFYGHAKNLANELQTAEWQERLEKELGLRLHFPTATQWHDYSQTDCVIAVRDFSNSPHWNKSATKLYNAWLAGVPFIGGIDSAYAADGRPGIDYLVAKSPEQVFEHLRKLKEDCSFRSQLIFNGSISAKEFTGIAILDRWKNLVETIIPQLALRWKKKNSLQPFFFAQHQKFHLLLDSYSWNRSFKKPAFFPLEVFFVMPLQTFPSEDWIDAWEKEKFVALEEKRKCVTSYSWIYQTWSLLKKSDFPCHIVHDVPNPGAAIFLSAALVFLDEDSLSSNLFLVDIVAHNNPHPKAQFHLVHNRAHARWLPRSFFIPHWPQPYMIPRNPQRGDRFEHICFLGDPKQLAREFFLPAWKERLQKELQLQFSIKMADEWHDYSDVDAVIALRDTSSKRHLNKPATKLYNAWHAGVPFIGGPDSAYAADGRPGIDYLVASSVEETFQQLQRLKEDPVLRHQLVKHGTESGKAFTREATLQRWHDFLSNKLPKLVKQWQKKSTFERYLFMRIQKIICFLDRCLRW